MAGREYPVVPIVGVGAVVLDGNRVLLVRRGQEPMKREWSIPGGALELGETLQSAVRREVIEETGLDVEAGAIVEVLDKIVVEADRVRYHYVLIDFLCKVLGGVLKPGSDADDARWVSHEELNSHGIYRVAPATIAAIEKAFQMAGGRQEDASRGAGSGTWFEQKSTETGRKPAREGTSRIARSSNQGEKPLR